MFDDEVAGEAMDAGIMHADDAEPSSTAEDADVVIGIAVDHENLGVIGLRADLLALARGAERGPQARKAGSENENARHLILPLLTRS